mmetsp:Transcript_33165/g.71657  ORF Transcript_33165/g.71657 Transcript_33165/m.71657 type:complete len:696 (-) Transcript_33165:259-2346(-)
MPTTMSQAKTNAPDEGGKAKVEDAKSIRIHPLVLRNYTPNNLQLFRCLFYIVMAYNWYNINHHPCNEWEGTFAYYHTRPLGDTFCPRDQRQADLERYVGSALCILCIFSDLATIFFAAMQNIYVFSYITRFVNHEYLFGLLAILMVFVVFSKAHGDGEKHVAWTQCLRGQIVVVYFYAAVWKLIAPTWLDGSICRGIFLSFEENGVASGVPWSLLEQNVPHLFKFLALTGLFLDALLAGVLLFCPAGHWVQQVGVLFHGFTALTMAQRIGYSFPATMLAAGLLFRPVIGEVVAVEWAKATTDEEEMEIYKKNKEDQPELVEPVVMTEQVDARNQKNKERKQTKTNANAMNQSKPVEAEVATKEEIATEESESKKENSEKQPERYESHATWMHRNWKRHPLITAWLLVQWLLPARMPIVSNGRYKHTGEGYRFSWTMMLHSSASFFDGANFFTLRVYCGDSIFPSPVGPENPDVKGFPIHRYIGARGSAALNVFPRQLPAMGAKVAEEFGKQPLCRHPGGITVFGSMLMRTDDGPFHRIVDPEQNLVHTHNALLGRNLIDTVVGTMLDKAPSEQEFILKDVGSFWDARDLSNSIEDGWIYVVDRLSCLAADPIAIFGQSIEFMVVESPEPLWMEWCGDLQQNQCIREEIPAQTEPILTPQMAVIKFQTSEAVRSSCRSAAKEDILIKFRFGPSLQS